MNQNMMALLSSILAGKGAPMSGMASQPAPAAAPMQPQMQKPATAVNRVAAPQPQSLIGTRPGEHGNDPDLVIDGSGNGGGNPTGDKGDGKGGGKGNNNARLSDFERQMRRIGNKGPQAYSNAIEKNLGFRKPTIGYGAKDPSEFRTGMTQGLSDVLMGTQPKIY